MNYGRFFEFDFESSKLDAGIAVFNYRWLQDRSQEGAADKLSPRYPIYLTFTSEAIVFNLHYREEGQSNTTGKAIHYHNPIIELVLSPNMEIADGLTESLNETYLSEFPVCGNAYLRKMICNAYENDSFNTQDNYSSLKFYDVETQKNYEIENNNVTHFLRKVILDFLFDFEFTGVFRNLAFYNEVSIKLKENFLFSSLMNKLRYYYLRMQLIKEETDDVIIYSDGSKKDEQLQFLFQRYELAEHEWVESILQPKAMKAFHESPWFNECHEELEQVYSVCRLPKLCKQDKKNAFGLTVNDLLKKIHKKQSQKSKARKEDSFDVFDRAVKSHHETARMATKWEVEHFRLWGVIRIWCGDKTTIWLSMCALLLALAILWEINHGINSFNNYWAKNINCNGENLINSGWKFIIITAIGGALLVTFRWLMCKKRRSTWGIAIPSLLMPRLLAAIVAAWFTMCMSEEVFLKLSQPDFNWSAAIIVFAITIAFILYESYMVNPFDDNKWHHVASSICIFLLAYAYAYATGTLIYDYFGQNFLSVYMEELKFQGIEYQLQSPPEGSCYLYLHGKELIEKADSIMRYRYLFIAQISFFATFIGIFLQLMLQGVSITKSE